MEQVQPNKAFFWGILLNLIYIIAEVAFGIGIGSVALVADAIHNMSDVLGLGLAWFAEWLSNRHPTVQRTYGYKSSSILAALANAAFLLVAMGAIIVEAITRLSQNAPVEGGWMMVVAGAGILVNGATAILFHSGSQHDLNIRGAFMHMAGVSLGVVLAGGLILLTGWEWLDPVMSILVAIVVLIGTWDLLRDAVNLAMAAVPKEIDPVAVKTLVNAYPTVASCHDLHIWALSTTDVALTVHVVRTTAEGNDAFLDALSLSLRESFDIAHTTIQVEYGPYLPDNKMENPY
ncbi:cation transporter [Lacticaseibacillus rhamnosus]|uniref:Cation transporter n=2 Tax=Lacticaseibacillus rhamnosus TaxID=47715 RepID=A0AB74I9N8_LACRH|nr:cation diffusion facilitator family transporter [Lacticaseibacillus rhamnosus]AGP75257.1 Cobalt-zinc-cadmium resistance protein CzcD [Lacticaseibacillus rhamnosus LOCK908]KMO64805.1 cation transporter [Lacticaseibacillus rhamnosus]KRK31546.1 Co Zn Cd efflux system component [Lacticaseibacillus rhamnosus DSM 20021 = JCM 1136 = NBRC 3425]MCT3157221.1 cation transporter [Lacticaseibacillus rhamnosus]MCT3187985.1 cation transporter [Lacticaseibacillus rhamnosus]